MGEGPFYLALRPQDLDLWVETLLPDPRGALLPRREPGGCGVEPRGPGETGGTTPTIILGAQGGASVP